MFRNKQEEKEAWENERKRTKWERKKDRKKVAKNRKDRWTEKYRKVYCFNINDRSAHNGAKS